MRWAAAVAVGVVLTGCSPREAAVEHAWVRLPAVPGRPAAAYFTAHGGRADTALIAVTSPRAHLAELHESMAAGMRLTPSVPVPAGKDVVFAPGGRHVMLFGVDPRVTPGTAVPLRFVLARGRVLDVKATAVGPADPAP